CPARDRSAAPLRGASARAGSEGHAPRLRHRRASAPAEPPLLVAVRAPPLLAGLAVGDLLAFARGMERIVHVAGVLGVVEGLEVPDVGATGVRCAGGPPHAVPRLGIRGVRLHDVVGGVTLDRGAAGPARRAARPVPDRDLDLGAADAASDGHDGPRRSDGVSYTGGSSAGVPPGTLRTHFVHWAPSHHRSGCRPKWSGYQPSPGTCAGAVVGLEPGTA